MVTPLAHVDPSLQDAEQQQPGYGSEEATDRTEGNHSSLDQYNADTSYVLDSIEGKSLKKGIAPFGKETVDQLTKLYNQGMIGISRFDRFSCR